MVFYFDNVKKHEDEDKPFSWVCDERAMGLHRLKVETYENGEMIIRHLILPNHVECCSKPILKWIADNLPDAMVNIMDQYYPTYKAYEYEEINRRITVEEYREVYNYARELGLNIID